MNPEIIRDVLLELKENGDDPEYADGLFCLDRDSHFPEGYNNDNENAVQFHADDPFCVSEICVVCSSDLINDKLIKLMSPENEVDF
jgi:hypothetical protein